jgi:hypothetical protein
MVPLLDLWLPILVAAVLVFVVSSVIHMALPIHKGDMKKLPNEERLLAAMRAERVAPGSYMFPCAGSMKEMGAPEFVAKMNSGPVGNMNVLPNGPWAMGKSLTQWFLLSLVISACAAYLAGMVLGPGAATKTVFRITSTAALLGYAVSPVDNSIWKGVSWSISAKFFFDGLLYALATGAAFAWLWPEA